MFLYASWLSTVILVILNPHEVRSRRELIPDPKLSPGLFPTTGAESQDQESYVVTVWHPASRTLQSWARFPAWRNLFPNSLYILFPPQCPLFSTHIQECLVSMAQVGTEWQFFLPLGQSQRIWASVSANGYLGYKACLYNNVLILHSYFKECPSCLC